MVWLVALVGSFLLLVGWLVGLAGSVDFGWFGWLVWLVVLVGLSVGNIIRRHKPDTLYRSLQLSHVFELSMWLWPFSYVDPYPILSPERQAEMLSSSSYLPCASFGSSSEKLFNRSLY